MPNIAELWAKEMEGEIRRIERLIAAAAERARVVQSDPLLNGQKQSVAALKNHLLKLADDAAALRRSFRPGSPEVEESVNDELFEAVQAERGKKARNGGKAGNGGIEKSGIENDRNGNGGKEVEAAPS